MLRFSSSQDNMGIGIPCSPGDHWISILQIRMYVWGREAAKAP